jgi:hypothetical protein
MTRYLSLKPALALACFFALGLTSVGAAGAAGQLSPARLRCEMAVDPLGVDVARPALSWQVQSEARGQRQTAYRVLVASTRKALDAGQGDLWDSGRVKSDKTIQIPYGGKALKSLEQAFWKIRVWDRDGEASSWSAPATWTMGMLSESDWKARWITGKTDTPYQSLLLRREFGVKPKLARAVAVVCGLGQYEMFVNGKKIGNDLLTPGWTKYDKTCLYDALDLTASLREGPNAIGLELGNGMYNVQGGGRYTKFKGSFGPVKAICFLKLEYADGSSEVIGTDDQWRAHVGPITFNTIYGGEDYDARLEQAGWDAPGFKPATPWDAAQPTAGPGGQLRGTTAAAPPLRAIETLKPVRVNDLATTVSVVDMGQNVSLMPRLRVSGPAGSSARMIPAELLKKNGLVDRGSSGGGKCWWQYTLAGKGSEEWFPQFFYHGCRYIQAELSPAQPGGALPKVESIEGVVVHSSAKPIGEFSCSNELFNRVYKLVRWAQRSNMVSVLTDCPQRERLGWLEQDHLNGPALRYNFDLDRIFSKGMNDMADSQRTNGLVPDTAPEYVVMNDGFRDSPEWGSAFILVPWQQCLWTGNFELARRYYDRMARYVDYFSSRAQGGIVDYGLGDWYDIGPKRPGKAQLTPIALTATAFYYQDAKIMAEFAKLLGKKADAKRYAALAKSIGDAFNKKFWNAQKGSYATGSQTANAIPLVMGLAPEKDRARVLAAIVADVQAHGNAITAGDVGYRYLLRALADGGRSDVIYAMNNQSDKPGYGYQLKQGATSLTEAWDASPHASQNHFMLGQINEWFFHDLAGIADDPSGPGFKKIVIHPQPVGDLTSAGADYESIRGKIGSHWTRGKDGGFSLDVEIPANATATVFVPAGEGSKVTEGGAPAAQGEGVRFLRREQGCEVFAVGSGRYRFASRLK